MTPMHRTQILIEDAQYVLLKTESARTGKSIGELVRTAVTATYGGATGPAHQDRMRQALHASAGAAAPDDFDGLSGEEYTTKVRGAWTERTRALWSS